MRRGEALAELELSEYASAAEIKAAYRDLVKVWHPDRFGDDARMRERAEERLQRINDAYRALESGVFDPEPGAGAEYAASAMPRVRVRTEAEREALLRAWVYVAIVVVMGGLIGYGVVAHRRQVREDAEVLVAQQAMRAAQASEREAAANEARTTRLGARENTVPELRGLTAGERTSVERVCAGATSFSQCAAEQVASLSTVQPRPDVSRLGAKDRSAIERACSSARDHDGPAAYDRCVVETEKLLIARGD